MMIMVLLSVREEGFWGFCCGGTLERRPTHRDELPTEDRHSCLSANTSAPNAVLLKFNDRSSLNRHAFANTTTLSSLPPEIKARRSCCYIQEHVWKQIKALLQPHTDKRSFIVYLWAVCTFSISDRRLISCNKNLYYLGNEWPWINNDVNKALFVFFSPRDWML